MRNTINIKKKKKENIRTHLETSPRDKQCHLDSYQRRRHASAVRYDHLVQISLREKTISNFSHKTNSCRGFLGGTTRGNTAQERRKVKSIPFCCLLSVDDKVEEFMSIVARWNCESN